MSGTVSLEQELLDKLKEAVVFFDEKQMEDAIKQWLKNGYDPAVAIFNGLLPGMEGVGKLYEDQVYFIPEMLLCSEVLYRGLEILWAMVDKKKVVSKGTVVIGVVNGDIHDIGKNIVKIMLDISGFHIYDLGRDVPFEKFIRTAEMVKPDIVCLSAMMTTTMFEMRKIIRMFNERNPGIRILVGGAPVSEKFARQWGASGYGEDVNHALQMAVSLMNQIKAG
ncbi:MAG: corrinoid protein [Firmicutes bacterium]|nr:corrinoid protein [Bacillota bacterium]